MYAIHKPGSAKAMEGAPPCIRFPFIRMKVGDAIIIADEAEANRAMDYRVRFQRANPSIKIRSRRRLDLGGAREFWRVS